MNKLKLKSEGWACHYCLLGCSSEDLDALRSFYEKDGAKVFEEGYDFKGLKVKREDCYGVESGISMEATINGAPLTDSLESQIVDISKFKAFRGIKNGLILDHEYEEDDMEWEVEFEREINPSELKYKYLMMNGCRRIAFPIAYGKQKPKRITKDLTIRFEAVKAILNGKYL